ATVVIAIAFLHWLLTVTFGSADAAKDVASDLDGWGDEVSRAATAAVAASALNAPTLLLMAGLLSGRWAEHFVDLPTWVIQFIRVTAIGTAAGVLLLAAVAAALRSKQLVNRVVKGL